VHVRQAVEGDGLLRRVPGAAALSRLTVRVSTILPNSRRYVRDTLISHNEITDLPYTGMSLGWGWGSQDTTPSIDQNNTVTDNYIHDVMQGAGRGRQPLTGQPRGQCDNAHIGQPCA
jgi:hypothetical protein